jgi:hypothetical protein
MRRPVQTKKLTAASEMESIPSARREMLPLIRLKTISTMPRARRVHTETFAICSPSWKP